MDVAVVGFDNRVFDHDIRSRDLDRVAGEVDVCGGKRNLVVGDVDVGLGADDLGLFDVDTGALHIDGFGG